MNSVLEQDLKIVSKKINSIEQFKNNTFLVTGATGLIGSLLVKSLLTYCKDFDANINVIAVIRNELKAKDVFSGYLDCKNLIILKSDVINPIKTDLKVDYIIHAASETVSKNMVTYPVETLQTALEGSKNLLELAKDKNVKGMVYLSSMEIFGQTNPSLEEVEEKDLGYIDIHNVRSCYPESKRMVENMCSCYAYEYKVPVKIARLAQTFGAGINKNENRVFAQFARSAIESKDIVLHTEGKSYGNYVYTRDALIAIIMLLVDGELGQAYNISNEATYISICDMAQMVANDIAEGKINVVFDIPKDIMKYGYAPSVKFKLSSNKMKQLGWIPEIGLKEAFQRLIIDLTE